MRRKLLHVIVAAGLAGLAACKDNTSPAALFNETTLTNDVAASSGDEMATAVNSLTGDETTVGMSAPTVGFNLFGNAADFSRIRTCYDSAGAAVAGCSPLSSVRQIVTTAALNTTRSDSVTVTGGGTIAFSGAVHRAADDTLTRNFVSGSEVSRTHSGLQTSHDTTTFSSSTVSRTHDEAAVDSIRGVTWNVPRLSHRFPISGYIVRVDTVHATFTSATATESRTEVKVVKVTFPPIDAEGNVTLTIDAKSCTLNLGTHRVSNCH